MEKLDKQQSNQSNKQNDALQAKYKALTKRYEDAMRELNAQKALLQTKLDHSEKQNMQLLAEQDIKTKLYENLRQDLKQINEENAKYIQQIAEQKDAIAHANIKHTELKIEMKKELDDAIHQNTKLQEKIKQFGTMQGQAQLENKNLVKILNERTKQNKSIT